MVDARGRSGRKSPAPAPRRRCSTLQPRGLRVDVLETTPTSAPRRHCRDLVPPRGVLDIETHPRLPGRSVVENRPEWKEASPRTRLLPGEHAKASSKPQPVNDSRSNAGRAPQQLRRGVISARDYESSRRPIRASPATAAGAACATVGWWLYPLCGALGAVTITGRAIRPMRTR